MIYVIIPVHNRINFTIKCLSCLQRQTLKIFKIIIVDDGSADGTSDYIKINHPEVILLNGDGNFYWAKCVNLGITKVLEIQRQDNNFLILSLNNDTKFNDDYLSNIYSFYLKNTNALIGTISLDVNTKNLLYAGVTHSLFNAKQIDNAMLSYNNDYNQINKSNDYLTSDTLPGRGLLISSKIIHTIGLLDNTSFIQHLADIDYSIRAKKAGFNLLIPTNTYLYEYADATFLSINQNTKFKTFLRSFFNIKSPIYIKARYKFAIKHGEFKILYLILDISRIIIGYLRRRFTPILTGRTLF